ncbi:081R [Cherax quadricarinatus iridovirus]|uniref:Uncharacterized protein n=1 Tax=Shrimp hemocyte iridescent virus TaxID=2039780 RepID=A0A291B0R9_9VIRU|nr:081R [Cherax quadricarinatus iridovirus]YP_010084823.1 hypothetical protein KM509_gp071 [Shrimp hemocyte iridescent virus]UPA43395.1 hypothetical protein 4TH000121 [Iridovirus CN01]ASZ85061.1 081R [Cherax quadricarinatus iridovirus]ATE87080.1 hypothetical protein [Shrimp hemocyte iridescent virus]UPA43471.1 hypothetical protein 3TG000038 [Iridovirus CN01]UPA43666.1 hypothetical protein 1DG000074 [Iridovirus CN01]
MVLEKPKSPIVKRKRATLKQPEVDEPKVESTKVEIKQKSKSKPRKMREREYHEDEQRQEEPCRVEEEEKQRSRERSVERSRQDRKQYPPLVQELIKISMQNIGDVRASLANRKRQQYKDIFNSYKENLSEKDYSIIKSALYYIYDFSRINSIDKRTALWLLSIYEIPIDHIVYYTSKNIIKEIVKEKGLKCSNKKADEMATMIRGVIDCV